MGCVLRLAPLGVGIGMFQSPNNSAVMGAVPRERLGLASGLLTLSRTLGHTAGIPLAGALFTALVLGAAGLPLSSDPSEAGAAFLVRGIEGVYLAGAAALFAVTALGAVCWRLDRKGRKA